LDEKADNDLTKEREIRAEEPRTQKGSFEIS
jgi:hypothetical protein